MCANQKNQYLLFLFNALQETPRTTHECAPLINDKFINLQLIIPGIQNGNPRRPNAAFDTVAGPLCGAPPIKDDRGQERTAAPGGESRRLRETSGHPKTSAQKPARCRAALGKRPFSARRFSAPFSGGQKRPGNGGAARPRRIGFSTAAQTSEHALQRFGPGL